MRKKCSSDREKLLKFKVEGQEFANFLRSLEQFIKTVKGKNNFWQQNTFFNFNLLITFFEKMMPNFDNSFGSQSNQNTFPACFKIPIFFFQLF